MAIFLLLCDIFEQKIDLLLSNVIFLKVVLYCVWQENVTMWLLAIWTEAFDTFLPGLVGSETVGDDFTDFAVAVVCPTPEKVGIREEEEWPLGLVLVTSGDVFRFGEVTFLVVATGRPNARVTVFSLPLGGVWGVDKSDGRDDADVERTVLVLLEGAAEVAAVWGFDLGVNDLDLWGSPAFLKVGIVVLILEGVEDRDGVLRDTGVKDRETLLFGDATEANADVVVVVVFLGPDEDLTVLEGRSVGMLEGRSVGMFEGRTVEVLLVGFEDGSLSSCEKNLIWSL